jgi:hypothetical protein
MADSLPLSALTGVIDAMEVAKRIPTVNATHEWEDGYACAVTQYTEALRAAIKQAGLT